MEDSGFDSRTHLLALVCFGQAKPSFARGDIVCPDVAGVGDLSLRDFQLQRLKVRVWMWLGSNLALLSSEALFHSLSVRVIFPQYFCCCFLGFVFFKAADSLDRILYGSSKAYKGSKGATLGEEKVFQGPILQPPLSHWPTNPTGPG